MSDVEPRVDRDTCYAFGVCRQSAPEVFGADGEGKATVLDGDAPRPVLEDAVDSCPVGAISLVSSSGEVEYP